MGQDQHLHRTTVNRAQLEYEALCPITKGLHAWVVSAWIQGDFEWVAYETANQRRDTLSWWASQYQCTHCGIKKDAPA